MITQNRTDLSGQRIDNYELDELLIPRVASDFYIGRDVKLDQPVFIEIMHTTEEQDPGMAGRFQNRSETVSQLKNPNIVPVIDVGVTEDGYPYAILEYIAGDWLENKLADWREEGYLLPVEEALLLARQIASALSAAHSAGLVDPDLRPENILISDSDNMPVIVDLTGPVTVMPRDSVLTNGQSTSLDYASPEEIEGKAIGRRSNIYSLGIILYELLTGDRPRLPVSSWDIFERSTMPKEVPLEEERQGLSGETYRLVRNCLWRQEWSRFESADELISAIDTAILAEQSLPKATLWTGKRQRWLYIAVPVIALLFIVFGLVLVWSQFAKAQQGQTIASPTIAVDSVLDEPNDGLAVVDLGTPNPTATLTREAPPTSAAETTIPVFGPPAEQSFSTLDIIDFAWIWLTLPRENEVFAVYLIAEDTGGESILVGTVEEPDNASLYLLEKSAKEIGIGAGSYLWHVRLEDKTSGNMVVESDPRRFAIMEEPTPTQISATHTPSPTATESLPSATPTEEVCTPRAPFGWLSHRVQLGESPSLFSQRANVPVQEIFDANCLPQGAILSIGQLLYIPPPLATNTPTPGPATATPEPTIKAGGGGGGNGGGTSTPKPPPVRTSTPKPPS